MADSIAQDTWQVKSNLSVNAGLRYQYETFPSNVLDGDKKQFDPRAGFAYNLGGKYNMVIRGGGGLFHGIIPMPLSCVSGAFLRRDHRNIPRPPE